MLRSVLSLGVLAGLALVLGCGGGPTSTPKAADSNAPKLEQKTPGGVPGAKAGPKPQ